MEEKKFKIEFSKVGLVFTILFALCLLVWTFILGVWIGTKIGEKPEEKEVALKPEKEALLTPPLQNETGISSQNETATINETQALSNQSALVSPKETLKEEVAPSQAQKPEKKVQKKVAKSSEEKGAPTKEVKPEYKKKEVAQLATRLKEQGYFIQVGAFSQKEKAQALKDKAGQLGFYAQIKEINSQGKILYKVLIGGYDSRSEAEKVIPEVKKKLGIENPFIVEL
ncbi:MAG: SPOR domain-containing protein [Caldimicrobium sp.]